jgi:hypothetical protein
MSRQGRFYKVTRAVPVPRPAAIFGLVAPVYADTIPGLIVILRFEPEIAGRTLHA